MQKHEWLIDSNTAGQRLDRFLTKQGLTIGVIRKALRNKDLRVCEKRPTADYFLTEGDTVTAYLPDGALPGCADTPAFAATAPADVAVIYEDENILLADKPQGLPADGGGDCLIERIRAYSRGNTGIAWELCNRIDRNTGGIVIAAKNAAALRTMNARLRQRKLTKLYLCILAAVPAQKEATLTAFLEKRETRGKHGGSATVVVSGEKTPQNRTIVTKYRVLAEKDGLALAEIDLLTGRTHQIRAHMAYIGCPLLGDGKYGRNRLNKQYGFDKQALYSYKLAFAPCGDLLDYLCGREFCVEKVWFTEMFGIKQISPIN